MKIERQIRDPVHGFIGLTKEECELLDTPALQRLRRIRQLAMASLVYPGALHTRFDHTLGVLHVAGQMCIRLEIEDRYAPTIRLAALLHDTGHGPFSHVSESVLKAVARADLAKVAGKAEKIHELITRDIILSHPGFEQVLSRGERQNVADLLEKGLKDPIHRSIISGPLDADKQDYLLRDSLFCGVRYGLFDIAQLHNVLVTVEDGGQNTLMVEREGIHVIEQFVLAKYYLTTQVYRHKLRLITDQMLIRALTLGVLEDSIPCLRELFIYDPSPAYIERYLNWDDSRLTQALLSSDWERSHAGVLFRRLVDRRLFKRVCQVSLNDLSGKTKIGSSEGFLLHRGQIEDRMAAWIKAETGVAVDKRHVIAHHYSIESARAQSRNSERSIPIRMPAKPSYFEDESTLFQSIDEQGKEEFVECYAPLDTVSRSQRAALAEKARDHLINVLSELFPNGAQPVPTGGEPK